MTSSAPAPGLSPFNDLYLPAPGVDLSKWCVVACDQYTSQPEYWENVAKAVGDAPSTLNIIYPEVYLNECESAKDARIARIEATMKRYVETGVVVPSEWPIYVERTVCGHTHRGIVVAVDLEAYEFTKNATTLIRPTEETIVERLPPRMRIRRHAPLESPHILLLIDDPARTVIEPLAALAASGALRRAYSAELMLGGGALAGYAVEGAARAGVYAALGALASPAAQEAKYGPAAAAAPLLYAVGDGNHSLATAKQIWEERKAAGDDPATSPARYALVEINNVHDDALCFEPIHRVLEGPGAARVLGALRARLGGKLAFDEMPAEDAVRTVLAHGNAAPHMFAFVSRAATGVVTVADSQKNLAVATLQPALDAAIADIRAQGLDIAIDYVHGESVVVDLGAKDDEHCGILLPPMLKSELFPTVVSAGLVPRKTFSMGHANEKRYYMECRKIL